MRVCENGVFRDETSKEIEQREKDIEEYEKWLAENPPEPTPEEKLAELEKQLDDLSATLVNQI